MLLRRLAFAYIKREGNIEILHPKYSITAFIKWLYTSG